MTTTEKAMIGGVVSDAPLFNKAPPEFLAQIVNLLSAASYHFADDSVGEWGHGTAQVQSAARMVNEAGLGFYAIQCLHRDKPQLVTMDQFVDAILQDARQAKVAT
jgi:hypothetical protein